MILGNINIRENRNWGIFMRLNKNIWKKRRVLIFQSVLNTSEDSSMLSRDDDP